MTDFSAKRDINSRKRLTTTEHQLMDIGKLPPQAIAFEEAVLGAAMLEKGAFIRILSILKPESFYKDAHAKIYSAMLDMFNRSETIDIMTITQELKRTGELDSVGGGYYIATLTNRVGSSANIEAHAEIIQQKFIAREIIRVSTVAINAAYEEKTNVFQMLEASSRELFNISAGGVKQDLQCTSELVKKALDEIEIAGKSESGFTGCPAGIKSIDALTGGWQKSDLIIIAARPSMGKTALSLTVAANAAFRHDKKVAFFSLEMSKMQLIKRLLSSEAEINSYLLKSGKLDENQWKHLYQSADALYKKNLFIDDTSALSTFELRAKARRFVEQHGCELLVVDYLQLMTGDKTGNREQEISSISRALKATAKDLDVPLIALSQMNRSVETRGGDKRPQLSDLRESGAIEQDADVVAFIYRPEYYGITQDAKGTNTLGYGELIVSKNRNGATDSADMRYHGAYTKFTEWDEPMEFSNAIAPHSDSFTTSQKSLEDDLPF